MMRLVALCLFLALPAAFSTAGAQSPGAKPPPKGAPAAHRTSGVVKSVNRENGTASIAHEAVPSLRWPAMTMTFKVANREQLETLKQGAKVDFSFVQSGRDYVITQLN
jgi:Cu(I)/Ag(I) efflux system protein CusF